MATFTLNAARGYTIMVKIPPGNGAKVRANMETFFKNAHVGTRVSVGIFGL